MRRLIDTLARPSHLRVATAVIFAIAFALAPLTDRRSFGAAMLLVGVIATVTTWALWTDYDGIWSRHAERERKRVEGAYQQPLARSTAARWIIELNRTDTGLAQGLLVNGLVAGPVFVVAGVLILIGVIDLG